MSSPAIRWWIVKATLFDGSYHEVDSNEMAFKVAGSMAFKNGARDRQPGAAGALMKVEVVTPEEYMGDVMGDLNRRRGVVQGMEDAPGGQDRQRACAAVRDVRLCHRSAFATQGRATYTMEFDHYSEAPASVSEKSSRKPPDCRQNHGNTL